MLMHHPPLVEIYDEFKRCLADSPQWDEYEHWFSGRLIDWMDISRNSVVEKFEFHLRFLGQDQNPDETAACSLLGGEGVGPRRSPGPGKLNLLGMCEGVRIYELATGWKWTQGTLVGEGDNDHGGSPICEKYYKLMDPYKIREALQGQDLVVAKKDLKWAEGLCEAIDLRGEEPPNFQSRRKGVQRLTSGLLTASYLGVVLRSAVQVRPGKLGAFARLLPCCALKAFRRPQAEVLPVPLPRMEDKEKSLDMKIQSLIRNDATLDEEQLEALKEEAKEFGVQAWTWLQMLTLNYMYCCPNGDRMLHDVMMHSVDISSTQQSVINRQKKFAERWVENDEKNLEIAPWNWTSEQHNLGEMYTGASIGKSYPLTLEAIIGTKPGEGQAGQIDLASVVGEKLKKYVENPDLLRIPDEELVDPRTSATVQVASQEEWEQIVSHLVKAGMLEREVEAETLRCKGEPVRNGMFGVHKV